MYLKYCYKKTFTERRRAIFAHYNLRDRLSHRPADVIRDGNPADLGQVPVDLQISAVRGEKRKSDRGGFVQKLQFGWLVGHLSIR
jgi:hypothetical protein